MRVARRAEPGREQKVDGDIAEFRIDDLRFAKRRLTVLRRRNGFRDRPHPDLRGGRSVVRRPELGAWPLLLVAAGRLWRRGWRWEAGPAAHSFRPARCCCSLSQRGWAPGWHSTRRRARLSSGRSPAGWRFYDRPGLRSREDHRAAMALLPVRGLLLCLRPLIAAYALLTTDWSLLQARWRGWTRRCAGLRRGNPVRPSIRYTPTCRAG